MSQVTHEWLDVTLRPRVPSSPAWDGTQPQEGACLLCLTSHF